MEQNTNRMIPAENRSEAVAEAFRIYNLLKTITADGCDAEVKQVKGKLKILKVQKKVAAETELKIF
jgi:hypothetical protein